MRHQHCSLVALKSLATIARHTVPQAAIVHAQAVTPLVHTNAVIVALIVALLALKGVKDLQNWDMDAVSVQAVVWINAKAVAPGTAMVVAPGLAKRCVKAIVANHASQVAAVAVLANAQIAACSNALATMKSQLVHFVR